MSGYQMRPQTEYLVATKHSVQPPRLPTRARRFEAWDLNFDPRLIADTDTHAFGSAAANDAIYQIGISMFVATDIRLVHTLSPVTAPVRTAVADALCPGE